MAAEVNPVKADLSAKYIASLDLAAAKSDVRYYLNGIYVEPIKGGGVYMVATNGHMMLVVKDEEAYASRRFIMKTRKDLISACKYKVRKSNYKNDCVTRLIVTETSVTR